MERVVQCTRQGAAAEIFSGTGTKDAISTRQRRGQNGYVECFFLHMVQFSTYLPHGAPHFMDGAELQLIDV